MKLISFLRLNKLSDLAFAESLGVSRAGVRKWMYGQRVPRADEMLKIIAATNGDVMPNDFFDVPSASADQPEGVAA